MSPTRCHHLLKLGVAVMPTSAVSTAVVASVVSAVSQPVAVLWAVSRAVVVSVVSPVWVLTAAGAALSAVSAVFQVSAWGTLPAAVLVRAVAAVWALAAVEVDNLAAGKMPRTEICNWTSRSGRGRDLQMISFMESMY
jgi:hypothetical protein